MYQAGGPTPGSPYPFCITVRIDGWDGKPIGALVVGDTEPRDPTEAALRHLRDLASLAANELEMERRRMRAADQPDRRRTQEQLLEKTLELTKFSEDLRQIHRLSITNYDTLDSLLADYLETGRAIFGLSCAVVTKVRGRYATVVAVRSDGVPLRGATAELDSLYSGAVVDAQQTVAVEPVAGHPLLAGRPNHGSAPQHCYIGAPVLVDGEVWGVLSFSAPYRRWREFTSHEVEVIELMAKSVARFLLERRMQASRERAEALESDRSRILEQVAKNSPLPGVLDNIAGMVERQAPALEVRIFLAGQTPAGDGDCQAAKVPVRAGNGEVLGLVRANWRIAAQPRHLDEDLLEMAAQLAAIAIEQQRLTERLQYQARHDVLTSLPNRTLFTESLAGAMEEARTSGRSVAVVFVDLDRFKQINDHWGHAVGDTVLRETASRLRGCLRAGESAGRLGGDEFVAMLKDFTTREDAVERARLMLEALRAPIEVDGHNLMVTASIGLSLYPQSGRGESAEALLAGADQAMYQVKHSGKNSVLLSQPEAFDARATSLQLEHSLRRALDNGEFRLYFQPVLDIRAGSALALDELEVLLGWDHPKLGRIGPGQFIPIAEECGMIASIGAWVLRQACLQSAEWRRMGLPPVRIAVNVSPLQFSEPGFVQVVRAALAESGLPAGGLELELTESAILADISASLPKLERLRELGVRITLDDFGTGYSSLTYLRWMPVQSLKIDRSFVADMTQSVNTSTLIQAMIALAHSMNLTVVAEGIEQERQFEMLARFDCDYAQGHLFGEPLPVEEMEQWLMREALTSH
ncbi:MAG: EAL domain-containing protein [Bryobacteraceae bacterium]|nr:EAL domain-containing protein [Bryobacteraceae bacterium]